MRVTNICAAAISWRATNINSSSEGRQLYNAAVMSQEVSTAGRTGRFSRINPERPERHDGYPTGRNISINQHQKLNENRRLCSNRFAENRSYSPSAFPENLSIYEKGTGAAYMAAAGWGGRSMADAPTSYPTSFGRNSNGKSRCLIIVIVVLIIILILFAVAIGVLFATKGPSRSYTYRMRQIE